MTRKFTIKVCGPTTVANAVMLADAGVDAIGLNFYPQSRRWIDYKTAKSIAEELSSYVRLVGLFVDSSLEEMQTVQANVALDTWQTYDFADPGLVPPLVTHWPSFRVRTGEDLVHVQDYCQRWQPAAVLIDSYVPGQHGGTGVTAPWELLAGFDPGVPWLLAGGLTPDNVADAIRLTRPDGVDVAGGVESAPGVKDNARVTAFIAAARGAAVEIRGN